MAEQTINTPALAPPLLGLPLGEARRVAKKRAQAKVEFKLVDSEAKALTVVRQHPEAGDELNDARTIKVEIASRPAINYLPGIYQDADEENADFLQRFLLISAHLTSGIEENLEFVHELFDSRITNEKWLPWLPSSQPVPLLRVGKTGRIGVDARIGGLEDVPATQDEELQKLGLGKKQS